MKAPLLALAALVSSTLAALALPITRSTGFNGGLTLKKRGSITESLVNNMTAGYYLAEVTVGTPPQTQILAIDSGSADAWVLSVQSNLCSDPALQVKLKTGGCLSTFDANKSSTYHPVNTPFSIRYLDGTGAKGQFMTDNFNIGGKNISNLQMGLADTTILSTAILGIGYDTHEVTQDPLHISKPYTYPNMLDQMVAQGHIATKAYSLYLDDISSSSGSIIFGGLDTNKYSGPLFQVPVVPNVKTGKYDDLAISLSDFGYSNFQGHTCNVISPPNFNDTVILDSGTSLTYLPNSIVSTLYYDLKIQQDPYNHMTYVACNIRTKFPNMTFDFYFGGEYGITINVPVREMILDLDSLFGGPGIPTMEGIDGTPCLFAIGNGDIGQRNGPYFLGDTFLRSAYVVYDLQHNLISLAQTVFNSNTSHIVDFQAGNQTIPSTCDVVTHIGEPANKTGSGMPGGASRAHIVRSLVSLIIWSMLVVMGASFIVV